MKTFEARASRAIRLGMIHGAVLGTVIPFVVVLSGQTFGQRYAHTHAGNPHAIGACVDRLAAGEAE